MSVQGAIDIAQMVHPDNPEATQLAKNIAGACEHISDSDRCEFAAKLMLCSQEAAMANGMDPKKML